MSDFDNIDPENIDLLNLHPQLQAVVATLLAIQHCGNRPASVGHLMDGIYGESRNMTPEQAIVTCKEYARILARMYGLGWITRVDANGCIFLTDIGDEKATVLKRFYEAAGRINFSAIPS
jgi:hypothetical protein